MKLIKILILLLIISNANAQSWIQEGNAISGSGIADTHFGYGVELSANGNIMAVCSEFNEDGEVYIYKKNTIGNWVKDGVITSSDLHGSSGANKEPSISLNADGSIIAIGFQWNNLEDGVVRIYKNEAGNWSLIKEISEDGYFRLGSAVSLNNEGNILAVYLPKSDVAGANYGETRIYYNNGTDWIVMQYIYGENNSNKSHNKLTLSGDGMTFALSNYANSEGMVKVYRYNSDFGYEQIGNNLYGDENYDYFGSAISLSTNGDTIAIGAESGSDNNRGEVKVFNFNGTDWFLLGSDIPNVSPAYHFGKSVNLSANGKIVAIGAPDYGNGECRIFKYINSNWEQIGQTITGSNENDKFGNSVKLSADGNSVAVGIYFNDSIENNAGIAKVYKIDCDINTPPIPVNTTLTQIQEECSATITTVPEAVSSCGATIIGYTSDPLSYTEQGTYEITWIYEDSYGNISTQIQEVIIEDVTPPILPTLAELTGECSVNPTAPTTTDNCAGTITGTSSTNFPITTQGTTVVTWNFDDGNGNNINVNQNVIIEDVTNPTITCVENRTVNLLEDETVYTVAGIEFDPTETDDNCNVASVVNDFNTTATLDAAEFPIGTTHVTWTVTDDAGNTEVCNFNVQVNAFVEILSLSELGISIYPNPSTGIFNIETQNNFEVTITDISGKIIQQLSTKNHQLTIDISNKANGVYFIKFQNERTINVVKVAKK